MGLQLGSLPVPKPAPGAGAATDPTTQTLVSANFDPTKGPVDSFNANGDLVGPDGKILLTSAQIHAGTVPDSVLQQIANNPYVKAAVNATTAPLVGGAQTISDAYNGKYGQIPGDLAYGATGGIAGNNKGPATGSFVTPQTIGQAVDATGKVVNQAGTDIATGAKDIANAAGGLGGSSDITTADADAETKRANALADALGVKSDAAGAQADTDRGLGLQTRGQQEQSIQDLQDAAAGKVASPAELQLKQQAGIDAARQYGLAAAMQSNNPAAALRQASMGAATVAGTTDQNAAILRANETANARNALATALSNVRAGDQSATNTDVSQQGTLTQGQLTSQGQGVTSTGQKLTAETEKAKADAIKQGALLSAAGSAGATLLSDKRSKDDVRRADLADAIGKGVHGVTFEYVPGEGDPDQHFGVLAQEIERVIPGVVKPDGRGMKRVDAGHLTTANTAMLAELARRIQDLEAAGGRKKAA